MTELTTYQQFKDFISEGTVLIDFYADWCGPCKMLAPVLVEIAREYQGRIKIAKINVDNNLEASQQYQITSIPTLIIFKNGTAKDIVMGYKPKPLLEDFIKKNL